MSKKNLEGLVASFNIFGINGKLRVEKLWLICYMEDSVNES